MLLMYSCLIDTHDELVVFENLYNTYKHDMFKVAISVVHNQYDAEDAVHNAFLSIIRNLTMIDRMESREQKAYLCRAARNRAINICVQKSSENKFVFYCEDEPYSLGDEDEVLSEICSEDRAEQIKKCILQLPEIYRDILHLHYVEDLKLCQIANLLGLKEATVRQRLRRGKKMLIESIKKLEES